MSNLKDIMVDKLAGNACVVDFLTPVIQLEKLILDMGNKQSGKSNISKAEKEVLAMYREELETQLKNIKMMLYQTDFVNDEKISSDLTSPVLSLAKLTKHFDFKLYIVKKEA